MHSPSIPEHVVPCWHVILSGIPSKRFNNDRSDLANLSSVLHSSSSHESKSNNSNFQYAIHVQYLCTIFNGQTKCPMDIFLSIGPMAYWNIKWTLEGVHWVFWIHWIQWSTAMSNGHLNVKWPCWPCYPGH